MNYKKINNLKNSDFKNIINFKEEESLDELLSKCEDLRKERLNGKREKSIFRISRNNNNKSPLFLKATAAIIIGGVIISAGVVGTEYKKSFNNSEVSISQEEKTDLPSLFKRIKEKKKENSLNLEGAKEVDSNSLGNLEIKKEKELKNFENDFSSFFRNEEEDNNLTLKNKKIEKEISKENLYKQHELASYIGISEEEKTKHFIDKAVSKYLEVTDDSLKDDKLLVDYIVSQHLNYLKKNEDITYLSSKIEMLDPNVPLKIKSQKMDNGENFHGLYSDGKLFAVINNNSLKYTKYAKHLEKQQDTKEKILKILR